MSDLNIPKLLDLIDPDQEIDRKQALLDLSLVAFYNIFHQASALLDDTARQEVLTLLSDTENLQFRNVYAIFEENKKTEQLNKIAADVDNGIRADYIKTQFNSLDESYKKELLSKYPELNKFGD